MEIAVEGFREAWPRDALGNDKRFTILREEGGRREGGRERGREGEREGGWVGGRGGKDGG